ncbi:MAG TPA: hypothetical protein VN826_01685 [Candidatus Eisenbacteria bacterium]|jgi:hypothetical protein|nr:hypothetical protein [Candidatus Eisenbacteria bacterium]
MKRLLCLSAAVATTLLLAGCSSQEEMAPKPAPAPAPAAKAEAKAPAEKAADSKAPAEKAAEKAKATKLAGDVGLLDTEKNYLIVVSKDGKLVTIDFDPKFQPTELKPEPAKVADIGLGSQAVVQYTKQGDKNVATSVEYRPAKGE